MPTGSGTQVFQVLLNVRPDLLGLGPLEVGKDALRPGGVNVHHMFQSIKSRLLNRKLATSYDCSCLIILGGAPSSFLPVIVKNRCSARLEHFQSENR